MPRRLDPRLVGALAAAVMMVAACSGNGLPPSIAGATRTATSGAASSPTSSRPVELKVLAASSLKTALDAAKAAYATSHPGVTVTVSTDSSAALATQIEQGARADVFLSADTANAERLVAAGEALGDAEVFAMNELTVIVPTGNPARIASPNDLAKPGVRVIAATDEVPITTYANQLVAKLAAAPGAPPGFAAGYAANVVTKVDNVRAVVAQIELGQGDAAIVYVTDARASTKVQTVAVPDDLNVRATYAGVVLKASNEPDAAKAFLEWLAGPGGQAVLAPLGFLPSTT